jgi:cation/acetate symporter
MGATGLQPLNTTTIVVFGLFLITTLLITLWAMRRTRTKDDFFVAGRSVTAGQNGLALAGDFMGAATLLGVVGLVSLRGFDGVIYAVGGLVGWPILVMLIAEPMRRIGRFTLADVVSAHLEQRPIRLAIALTTLLLVPCYLIAQLIGAAGLIRIIFGLDADIAIVVVGAIMAAYVLFGGMIATTWVQIIKAAMLLVAGACLTVLVLMRFGFNPIGVFREASARYGDAILAPGGMINSPWEAVSLGMGLMFGLVGLPHVAMRFFTVPDARAARNSVFYATVWIGLFLLVTFMLGYGALAIVGREAVAKADPSGNMATLILASEIGGSVMLGFVGAVTFATILALVAGLTLSASTSVAHDLWNGVICRGSASERGQIAVGRATVLVLCVVAVGLAIILRQQNVIFLTGLTFAIAASANFPALILSLFWRGLTTAGAATSILFGAIVTLLLIYGSPSIQADVMKSPQDIWFPLRNPGLVSIPASFIVAIIVSWCQRVWETSSRLHVSGVADQIKHDGSPA